MNSASHAGEFDVDTAEPPDQDTTTMTNRISALAHTLDDFAQGAMSVNDLARDWRDGAYAHEPELPQRYLDVMERLLNQLESSALFTEESCSFSHADMVAALADWLARARAVADANPPNPSSANAG